MRKLVTADVFSFGRCLKAIGVKDELREAAKEYEADKSVWDFGFDTVMKLLDLAVEKQAEKQIYEFLAGPFEMKAKEIELMPITELFDTLKKLAKENDLAGFFKYAAKLMK